MSAERQKWAGQKIEKELMARDLEGRLVSMRQLLRDHLDPHQPVAAIKFDLVAGVAAVVEDRWLQYCQLLRDIEQLKLSLGEKGRRKF